MSQHAPEAEILAHVNGGRVQVNVLRGRDEMRVSIYCREGKGWVGESLPIASFGVAEQILREYAAPDLFGDLGLTDEMVEEALAVVGRAMTCEEVVSLGLCDPLMPVNLESMPIAA